MKFSIITCTYNSVETLADTVRSVKLQSYRDYEHIFVDGGSTDGTLELISRLAPSSTILHGVNSGISAAMNAGLKAASGELVGYLHGDDYYADDCVLQRISDIYQSTSAKWIIGEYSYLIGAKSVQGTLVNPLTLNRLCLGNYIPHPATFVSRRFLLSVNGFSEGLKYCMDYDLWFKLFKFAVPVYVPHILAVFRVHSGSVSASNRRRVLNEELSVRLRNYETLPQTLPRYCVRYLKRWFSNSLI